MRNQLALILIIVIIFLSGCIEQPEKTPSAGISMALSSDVKQAKPSVPVTFILNIKNLASESAKDISSELLNLTGWNVENSLQNLNELLPNDQYTFSWIAYAPTTTNKTFNPYSNLFYRMETNAKLKIRVYDNDYLNTLKSEEREKIKGKSALLSSTISKNTPIAIIISLKQPFILTSDYQRFPFVVEIKNVGSGKVYSDAATYLPRESEENYVRFGYTSNSTILCDFNDGELVKLTNKSKSIACRLVATQEEVSKYRDFAVNFTISYSYLDKASTKIDVK